jgi:uncharacterized protein (DUF58 family)
MEQKIQNIQQYLKPEVVSSLKNLDLIARLIVEGFLVGLHKSPFHGFSVEFSEHRQYMPGDNIRDIDWKVLGRTGRYYIKQYEEETNVKVYILLDNSGSMGYSSSKITKIQYAIYLAAALSFLLIKQHDAVGLVTFSNKIHRFLSPKASQSYLRQIFKELTELKTTESITQISDTLHLLAEKIKRRSLILLLTEFLYEDPKNILDGLKHFRHYQHEIMVFNILDPNDLYFDFKNDAKFIDMETGEKIKSQPYFLKEAYQKNISKFYDQLQKECLGINVDFQTILTNEAFDKALIRYLLKRKKLF